MKLYGYVFFVLCYCRYYICKKNFLQSLMAEVFCWIPEEEKLWGNTEEFLFFCPIWRRYLKKRFESKRQIWEKIVLD